MIKKIDKNKIRIDGTLGFDLRRDLSDIALVDTADHDGKRIGASDGYVSAFTAVARTCPRCSAATALL